MAELKTKPHADSVDVFLNGILDAQRRQDCFTILEMMRQVTGEEPRMWGSSIVGFGDYHYKYASGREGDTFVTGFSPRKDAITLYVACYLAEFSDILARLGKHKTGKGCLYLKRLQDIDLTVLRELIAAAARCVQGKHPAE